MSSLPQKLVAVFFFFLSALLLIASCTSRKTHTQNSRSPHPQRSPAFVININTATENDLQKLPQVGPSLARKLIEHRERYGAFRRREDVLIVEGVSEKRFHQFEEFISTE